MSRDTICKFFHVKFPKNVICGILFILILSLQLGFCLFARAAKDSFGLVTMKVLFR